MEDAHPVHPLRRLWPDAPKLLYRKSSHEVQGLIGVNGAKAVGLPHVGSYLGQKLVVRHAGRSRELQLIANAPLDFEGYIHRHVHAPFVDRDIKKSLINGKRFDEVGIIVEDGMYLPRHLFIFPIIPIHHDKLRTAPLGRHHGLGRMHAKSPGLITGRRHHTARTVVAHGDGLSAQFGMVSLLHRSKEGIHVYMYYLALGIHKCSCKDRACKDTEYPLSYCRGQST